MHGEVSYGCRRMITIKSSSQDAVVLRYLLEKYPVTVKELATMLTLPRRTLDRVLDRLKRRGIIQLEPLPGKTYVRLVRHDIKFVGINPSQRKALKHTGNRGKKGPEAEDVSVAYQ